MLRLPDEQRTPFRTAVQAAADRDEVRHAVRNIHIALQDAIDLRKPLCVQSGRCCRFDEYGHKLFVTTMELGAFVYELVQARTRGEATRLPSASESPAAPPRGIPDSCPFQLNNLCSVHLIRPFGCRVFFCDETATEWQQAQYARFHAELKRLHDELGVPYFYIEWREALAALDLG